MRVGLQASQFVLWCGLHCSLSRWKGTNFDMAFHVPRTESYLLTLFLPPSPSPSSAPPFLFLPSFRQYSSRSLFPLFLFLPLPAFSLLPIPPPPLFLLPRPLFRLLPPHRH